MRVSLQGVHLFDTRSVKRKGSRVSKKIHVPQEAKELLDAYIEKYRQNATEQALFVGRYGNRLKTLDIERMCQRISDQANAYTTDAHNIKLTPHMLRHTFLKRVADKHGVHVAQEMSGNVSIREIFRYTKLSEQKIESNADALF